VTPEGRIRALRRVIGAGFFLRSDEGRMDRIQNLFNAREHVAVPEPQDPQTARFEKGRADLVVRHALLGAVLRPVELDDESMGETREVDDVGAKRYLPPEMRSRDGNAATQEKPELSLRIRRIAPERSGAVALALIALPSVVRFGHGVVHPHP
jgi:hypothetical protein